MGLEGISPFFVFCCFFLFSSFLFVFLCFSLRSSRTKATGKNGEWSRRRVASAPEMEERFPEEGGFVNRGRLLSLESP